MRPIERESPIPAYYQIAVHLRARILGREWQSGERIPPEETLAVEYGVSRVTMRQALAELVKDGLLARHQGRGTFVTDVPQPLVHNLTLPILFAGKLRQLGYKLQHTVLESAVFETPLPQVVEHLKISSSQPVAFLERRLTINDQPVAINRSWFSEALCPGIASQPLLDNSLSGTLAQRYSFVPVRSENWIEAARATESEAQQLEIERATPLLILTTTSFLAGGIPLEYSVTSWLGDNIRFHFDTDFSADFKANITNGETAP